VSDTEQQVEQATGSGVISLLRPYRCHSGRPLRTDTRAGSPAARLVQLAARSEERSSAVVLAIARRRTWHRSPSSSSARRTQQIALPAWRRLWRHAGQALPQ